MVLTPYGVRFMGRVFACTIGRTGLSDAKREGDGATPIGTHRIIGCVYRADRVMRPNAWAKPIGPFDLWSDDAQDAAYNHMVRAPYRYSHERLVRADRQYDIVLITDWNWPDATPGKGSAIFIHAWRRPGHPTAGCIAFAMQDLRQITARLRYGTRLIIPDLR
jgi:L,D-peptidoglycan transpeptidase YkuD (ErfK/YbiS/YcfS/YnhG family)